MMKASALHPFQCTFSVQVTARGVCLETALTMYNHRGTVPGFQMKVDLKIHKSVSQSLGNTADNLVLYSDKSSSVFSTCMSTVLANYLMAEATPGFIYCTSSWTNKGVVAAGLEQHNDQLGSEYIFLNYYVNLNSQMLKTIQLYPADCTHIFKETVALYAYFSTSIHIKSCNTEVWMTIFSVNTIDFSSFSLDSIVHYEFWKLEVFSSFMLGC